jgi:hypothetical protein
MFGPVPLALVHGKVLAKFNPPWRNFKWMQNGLENLEETR